MVIAGNRATWQVQLKFDTYPPWRRVKRVLRVLSWVPIRKPSHAAFARVKRAPNSGKSRITGDKD
jgi:hypothetical protein